MGYVVWLLITGIGGFVAGWMLRAWGLDGSTRMIDGYEREQRDVLLRELNTVRAERDDARTHVLTMRAAITDVSAATPERDSRGPGAAQTFATPAPERLAETVAMTIAPQRARTSSAGSATDDLQRIKGIGPKLEQTLFVLGITSFAQIAAWTDAEVGEVNAKLRFSGRIERDQWIEQARALIAE